MRSAASTPIVSNWLGTGWMPGDGKYLLGRLVHLELGGGGLRVRHLLGQTDDVGHRLVPPGVGSRKLASVLRGRSPYRLRVRDPCVKFITRRSIAPAKLRASAAPRMRNAPSSPRSTTAPRPRRPAARSTLRLPPGRPPPAPLRGRPRPRPPADHALPLRRRSVRSGPRRRARGGSFSRSAASTIAAAPSASSSTNVEPP